MEDHKDDLVLILAGYQKEMADFLQTNPGLNSRFPLHIEFPDYNQEELLQIADQICSKRQYQLSPNSKLALIKMLKRPIGKPDAVFGNARTVRNIIEKSLRRQAVRLIAQTKITREELIMIEPDDLSEVEE